MNNFKRRPVVFNLTNPTHRELFEWCNEQSTNFSDFARTVLYSHMQSIRYAKGNQTVPVPSYTPKVSHNIVVPSKKVQVIKNESTVSDKEAMSDLL